VVIPLSQLSETNIVIVYLLSILIIARFTQGYIYGIAASIIATIAFNYFFTIPYYTLSVNDPSYLITFIIMTLTAITTSALTSKVKQNASEAQEKEAETRALFQLTNRLTDAVDIAEISNIAVETISSIMSCRAACLCFDEMEGLSKLYSAAEQGKANQTQGGRYTGSNTSYRGT
jgi:two-component system sensor histidine kinase KdpD